MPHHASVLFSRWPVARSFPSRWQVEAFIFLLAAREVSAAREMHRSAELHSLQDGPPEGGRGYRCFNPRFSERIGLLRVFFQLMGFPLLPP